MPNGTNFIIDPSIFYWISTLANIQTVLAIFGGICIVGAITSLVCYIVNWYDFVYYDHEKDHRSYKYMQFCKKCLIIFLILGIIMITCSIFIPDKDTGIEMLVARTATFENVDWTVEQIQGIIDYIVTSVQMIK